MFNEVSTDSQQEVPMLDDALIQARPHGHVLFGVAA
jgi:hypothetical protein